jgi:hypothetical protein
MTTSAPKQPLRPGENGFKYKTQYGLIVVCKDEADQKQQFAKLCKLGYLPKVVSV